MGGASNIFEIETFLKNMFADPHILRIKSTFIRKLVGSFIINQRLEEAKKNYQAIGGGSPIAKITFALTEKLNALDPQTYYTYAMRYTPPYANLVIEDLRSRGIEEVVLFSMYPQYSTATTLSSIEDFQEACKTLNYHPRLQIIDRFYKHKDFIACIIDEIEATLESKDSQEFSLIFSAHGLPQSFVNAGDPYAKECEEHLKLLQNALASKGIHFKEILLGYQSKVGPTKWLEPSTQSLIRTLKNKKVLIHPFAFSIDNSETLFELNIELRQIAQEENFSDFLLCRCPNDSGTFATFILNYIKEKTNA